MEKSFLFVRFLLLSIVVCLAAATAAPGQETTGSIEGVVKDQTGAVVPNVSLTITTAKDAASGTTTTGVGAGFRRSITTNADGFFRVLEVPPGTYDVVTAATGGFGEARYENVTVAIGQASQLTITVNPGSTVNTVDVAASEAPPVDTTNSAVQTSINAQKLELIPKGMDFTSVLKTVPGTRPESRTGGFSIDGASGSENVFVIDGQEVTNFRTGSLTSNSPTATVNVSNYSIPNQLVQEVQVKSSGFEAEFGGATGGVISVVTKGGGNDYHGEIGMQFETSKFWGDPRPVLRRFSTGTGANFVQTTEYFNPRKAGGLYTFPTANFGGPIFKDKLYFYGSYSPQIFVTEPTADFFTDAPSASRRFVATETFRLKRTYNYAFTRIDATPINNLRLTATYLWNPIVDQGNVPTVTTTIPPIPSGTINFDGALPSTNFGGTIGTLTGRQLTDIQGGRQNSNNVTLQGVYTPTGNLVFSGRFSRGYLNEKLGAYGIPPGLRIICQNGSTATNPIPGACPQGLDTPLNNETIKDISIRTNYEADATYIFNIGGRHELKGGYQRVKIFNDVAAGFSTKGRITFQYGVPINLAGAGLVTPSAPICAVGQTTGCVLGTGVLRRQGTFGAASNLNQGLYIQDKYQPTDRLTLSLGVRFEKEDLPSFNGFAPPINFDWGDKLAPRLGFAFDVLGDGKTKLFGSYGRFYDRLKFNLPRGSFGGEIQLQDYFEILPGESYTQFTVENIVGGFTGASVCPTTGFITGGARSRCQQNQRVAANDPNATILVGGAVDPNLKPFRQTEFTLGVERQISRNYVYRMRYTYKNVDEAVEDAGIRNAADSEAYIIGNPGSGLHLQTLQSLGYARSTRPQRRYDGAEFVLEKRLSDNWYFNANYTFSRLFGNYSGLASSDEINAPNGRLAPGTSRAFDLPFIGFTATGEPDNGRLETDRPHVFNVYGAYIFDWMGSKTNSTELSAFQTVASGTPQTTRIYLVSTITPAIFTKRGDLGRSPTYSQTDFNVTHRYRFGRDNRFTIVGDLNFLNLFDQDAVTNLFVVKNVSTAVITGPVLGLGFPNNGIAFTNAYTSGALLAPINAFLEGNATNLNRKDARYGQPATFQAPRSVRFGFRLIF